MGTMMEKKYDQYYKLFDIDDESCFLADLTEAYKYKVAGLSQRSISFANYKQAYDILYSYKDLLLIHTRTNSGCYPYNNLELEPDADLAEIKRTYGAWKIKIAEYSKTTGETTLSNSIMEKMDESLRILSDPVQRKIYDNLVSPDLYQRLGVTKDASSEQIQTAYERIVKQISSYTWINDDLRGNLELAKVVLTDEGKKKLYYQMGLSNLYERLGVKKDATLEQITKAYRLLAMKLHTDRNNWAPKLFTELGDAFNVLSDAVKREEYDAKLDGSAQISGFVTDAEVFQLCVQYANTYPYVESQSFQVSISEIYDDSYLTPQAKIIRINALVKEFEESYIRDNDIGEAIKYIQGNRPEVVRDAYIIRNNERYSEFEKFHKAVEKLQSFFDSMKKNSLTGKFASDKGYKDEIEQISSDDGIHQKIRQLINIVKAREDKYMNEQLILIAAIYEHAIGKELKKPDRFIKFAGIIEQAKSAITQKLKTKVDANKFGVKIPATNGPLTIKIYYKYSLKIDACQMLVDLGLKGEFFEQQKKLIKQISKEDDLFIFLDRKEDLRAMMSDRNFDGQYPVGELLTTQLSVYREFLFKGIKEQIDELKEIQKQKGITAELPDIDRYENKSIQKIKLLQVELVAMKEKLEKPVPPKVSARKETEMTTPKAHKQTEGQPSQVAPKVATVPVVEKAYITSNNRSDIIYEMGLRHNGAKGYLEITRINRKFYFNRQEKK
jgi:curved DNA-binding protein CbpA